MVCGGGLHLATNGCFNRSAAVDRLAGSFAIIRRIKSTIVGENSSSGNVGASFSRKECSNPQYPPRVSNGKRPSATVMMLRPSDHISDE